MCRVLQRAVAAAADVTGRCVVCYSVLWLLVLLGVLAMFIYTVVAAINHYLSYPTSWAMSRSGGAALNGWPAITICSLAPVRSVRHRDVVVSLARVVALVPKPPWNVAYYRLCLH